MSQSENMNIIEKDNIIVGVTVILSVLLILATPYSVLLLNITPDSEVAVEEVNSSDETYNVIIVNPSRTAEVEITKNGKTIHTVPPEKSYSEQVEITESDNFQIVEYYEPNNPFGYSESHVMYSG